MGDLESSVSWVGLFEHQSPDQIATAFALADNNLTEEALDELRRIARQGKDPTEDPTKIDPGRETAQAASLFCSGTIIGRFYGLLSGDAISSESIDHYWSNYLRTYWSQNRALVAQEYALGRVAHAFPTVLGSLAPEQFDMLRGLSVFDQADKILLQMLPEIQENRAVTVLYPGAGQHVAPLLIAMKLIDHGAIDRAEYIYTEIELIEGNTRDNLRARDQKGSPTLPLTPYELMGPYGHCNGHNGIGEIEDCIYRSAYLFSLADPAFKRLSRRHFTIIGLSESLYDSSQESSGRLFIVAP